MPYQISQRHACFSMGKRISSHLPPLYLDYFLAEISDISEVQQFISISHEIIQQVVLVTQELILAEVINAEIFDSDVIHAIELIISQASSIGSSSSSPSGSSFRSSHQMLDSLEASRLRMKWILIFIIYSVGYLSNTIIGKSSRVAQKRISLVAHEVL